MPWDITGPPLLSRLSFIKGGRGVPSVPANIPGGVDIPGDKGLGIGYIPIMPMSFAYRKATQALNYFAGQSGGKINKMKALKLLYFADRFHLRKYGRPITNDEYFAMNFGPVPSGAKDLAEGSDFRPDSEKAYAGQYLNPVDALEFSSIAKPDFEVFSQTDMEALEFAWEKFGTLDRFMLADLTHEYPEWKRHEVALKSDSTSRVKMNFSDFLDDPPANFDPCHKLSEDERSLRREEVQELCVIHNLWN